MQPDKVNLINTGMLSAAIIVTSLAVILSNLKINDLRSEMENLKETVKSCQCSNK